MFGNQPQLDPRGVQQFARQIERAIRTCEHWETKRRKSEVLEDTSKMIARMYDKAAAYTNLIVAGGYAAFFTVWGKMGAGEHPRLHAAAALCTITSVIVLIGWEVFTTTHGAIVLRRVIPLLNVEPTKVRESLDRINGVVRAHDLWTARIWAPVLCLTMLPGFAGGLILIVLVVLRIVQG